MKNPSALVCLFVLALIGCSKTTPQCVRKLKYQKVDQVTLRQGEGLTLEYYIQLNVDGKLVDLVADTGSSNMLLANFSTSAPTEGNQFFISYGVGSSLTNILLQDHVGPVDLACGSGVGNFHFSVAQSCSGPQCLNGSPLANIAGLAYRAIKQPLLKNGSPTFFEDLATNQTIASDEFGMLLCGLNHDNQSQITFGGLEPALPSISFSSYTPIKEKSWYVVNAVSLSISGITSPLGNFPGYPYSNPGLTSTPCSDAGLARVCTILDSGTTISQIPTAMYQALKTYLIGLGKGLPSTSDCFWPDSCQQQSEPLCSSVRVSGLPNLVITFEGGLNVTIRPESYIKSTQNGLCAFGFAPGGDNFTILGQSVMENQYIHFDRKNGRIGFVDGFQACGN